jgi:hypothetical protein
VVTIAQSGTLRLAPRVIDLTEGQPVAQQPQAADAPKPAARGYRVVEFRAVKRATLRGFADIDMQNGLLVLDVSIHRLGGKAWAMPPGRPLLDEEGRVMLDAKGRRVTIPLLKFSSTSRRLRWQRAVVDAVRLSHPEALKR